jgi:hypothetical protein
MKRKSEYRLEPVLKDPDAVLDRARKQRGPVFGRGPGRPWNGIVEHTPCLWITWVADVTKRVGISPDQMEVEFYGVPIEMTPVQLTFGIRWYFLCPRCGRRCEAVYYAGAVGCRVCLRLGWCYGRLIELARRRRERLARQVSGRDKSGDPAQLVAGNALTHWLDTQNHTTPTTAVARVGEERSA